MSRFTAQRARLFVLSFTLTVLLAPAPVTALAAGSGGPTCRDYSVPVAIADGGPPEALLFGQLCYVGTRMPNTIQLLVHGITTNHLYWDFPFDNDYYSYVRAVTAAGYATFNVDRLGAGASSRPASPDVNISSGTTALHSLIQQLRSGAAVGHPFKRVLWVGHSFGSVLAWTEVSRYRDVDGVIVTGALHKSSPSFVQNALVSAAVPANLDPHFAGLGLDPGYLTTISGTRANLFYFAPTTDPRVVAVDEANKDTVTLAELATGLPLFQGPPPSTSPSRQINVPVLDVIGQRDSVFCAADAVDCSSPDSVQRVEAPYYSAQAKLRIVVVPATGHDLNLHLTAPLWYTVALAWTLVHVPPS
jgi:pimeloyl-ACP methyl ester carboxylesterase